MSIRRTHLAFVAFLTLATSCDDAMVEPGPPDTAALFGLTPKRWTRL